MADKGLKVEDDLALCGAHLALPAFTRRRNSEITAVGKVRIHVEQVAGQVQKKCKLVHNTLPIYQLDQVSFRQ